MTNIGYHGFSCIKKFLEPPEGGFCHTPENHQCQSYDLQLRIKIIQMCNSNLQMCLITVD